MPSGRPLTRQDIRKIKKGLKKYCTINHTAKMLGYGLETVSKVYYGRIKL